MSEAIKRYDVIVCGQSYSLVSDRPLDYINQAAALVDSSLKEVKTKTPLVDEKRAAVLVALQMAHRFLEGQASQEVYDDHALQLIELIQKTLPSQQEL
ncbi:MAG: cell division protein ZapA [Candidatus Babeliales bacterium]